MNKIIGMAGELEICDKIPCPNCGKSLVCLPVGHPLYDVQCGRCDFRAQVKTNNCKPKAEILGAGWDIMDKVLKVGHKIPSLIANFRWAEKGSENQEIRFYPFIPPSNLKKYQLSPTARRANYKMFRYTGLDILPHFVLLKTTTQIEDKTQNEV